MYGFTPQSYGERGFSVGTAPRHMRDAGWGVAKEPTHERYAIVWETVQGVRVSRRIVVPIRKV